MSISSFINSSGTTNPFWIAKTVVWMRSPTSNLVQDTIGRNLDEKLYLVSRPINFACLPASSGVL
ncbi:hypothetical protein [Nostoc sp. 'Peltigera membranacea cyanobiont' 210A]|uniref:hypothetical protein n=1 Tax=Nostoc sp. 'Peltigera membranacea cyanobiont' 210A TaxID=2014529 RepID=UPI001CB89DF6|nr:hypothetical protein [Nostoc sp. 'Peltigera membranacea cyanobiont' 210A]